MAVWGGGNIFMFPTLHNLPPSLVCTCLTSLRRLAVSAAPTWRTEGLLTHAAIRRKTAYGSGAWALARRRCALTLCYGVTCGVVRGRDVPVDGNYMIGGPAVATASAVHLKLEGGWARILAALNAAAWGRELCITEAVLGSKLHVELDLVWVLATLQSRVGKHCAEEEDRALRLHCTRESWRRLRDGCAKLNPNCYF